MTPKTTSITTITAIIITTKTTTWNLSMCGMRLNGKGCANTELATGSLFNWQNNNNNNNNNSSNNNKLVI